VAISKLASSKPTSVKKGPPCTVCRALAELPDADAAGLRTMLADKQRRYTEIAALIRDDEDTPDWVRAIAHQTYARHATGGCDAREKLRASK
jgi:hypothetical protein